MATLNRKNIPFWLPLVCDLWIEGGGTALFQNVFHSSMQDIVVAWHDVGAKVRSKGAYLAWNVTLWC